MTKRILSLFVCLMLVLTMSISSLAMSLTLKDYDNGHLNFTPDDLSVEYTIKGAGSNDGVIYVYSSGSLAALSDSCPPIYMDYIIAPGDVEVGSVGFLPSQLSFGKYTLLYVNAVDSAAADFEYRSEEQVLQNKKNQIYSELKAIQNPNGSAVKAVLTKRADTFSIISSDADMTDYNKVTNKDAVFAKMVEGIAALTGYASMIDLFEAKAGLQLKEETNGTGGGTDNINPGDRNNVFSERPSTGGGGGGGGAVVVPKPDTEQEPDNAPGAAVFYDMQGHWAEKYASALSERGIVNGYEDGSYRGENPISRAELAKIVSVAMGINQGAGKTYFDVDQTAWYAPYVSALSSVGVIGGFEDGTFRPDIDIIRQDAALMIYRAMSKKSEIPKGYTIFADELSISDYASEAVRALGDLGIITGDNLGAFNPQNKITRAELSALVCRCLDYLESR